MLSFGHIPGGLTNRPLLKVLSMLAYHVIGPDTKGIYSLAYPTPGAPHILTIAGQSISKRLADDECERLNEFQIIDRRTVIRDRADRMTDDIKN